MKKIIAVTVALTVSGLASHCLGAEPQNLDRASGGVYNVNFEKKCFEFITKTAYDPKTNEGKTRHKVYWDDKTKFESLKHLKGFDALKGEHSGQFYYLDKKQTDAVRKGETFSCRNVDVYDASRKVTGIRKDGKTVSALFTPTGKLTADVTIDGKTVPFKAPRKKFALVRIQPATADLMKSGLFKARIFGKVKENKFVMSNVKLTEIPDPRKTDDPNLPRFLVIGDSISMNYDKTARSALKGKVNYHRIEGNGGPSDRGVENADLWLGNYTKKGFHWDIIQFNHGLHDLKQPREEGGAFGKHATTLEEYKANLEKEIAMLKKTGAVLIWCNTTPVPNSSSGQFARRKDEDLVYNKAALEVVSKHPEILITDVNKAVRESSVFDEWRKGNNVHFKSDAELKILGDTVGATVMRAIALAGKKK